MQPKTLYGVGPDSAWEALRLRDGAVEGGAANEVPLLLRGVLPLARAPLKPLAWQHEFLSEQSFSTGDSSRRHRTR